MSKLDTQQQDRRKVIKLLGTSAAALPVLGLTGCGGGGSSGGDEESLASAAGDLAADAAKAVEETTNDAMEAAGDVGETIADEAKSAMDAAEEVAQDAMDAVEKKADDLAAMVEDAVDGTKVDESSAQAKSLGYRHDASTVDSGAQPRYAAGQQCSNCAVFAGGDAAWGACPIFAGNLVKATGWCSAYVASS